jgi:hypothetical protein
MAIKTCTKCGAPKEETTGFYFHKGSRGRKGSYYAHCKPCHLQDTYARNRARGDEFRKFSRERMAKQRNADPERFRRTERRKKLKKFDLPLEWWQKTFDAQGGVCAICRCPERTVDNRSGRIKNLAIDHDHVTNQPRGLLCVYCNTALHNVERSANWPARAAAYLRRFRADPSEQEQILPFGD